MGECQATVLSTIEAAALWPQLHRLDTEVIATRAGEHRTLRAGFAATGVGNLPRMPRAVVMGLRHGLTFRGVLVARRLSGGAAWEVVSLRLAREKDDEAIHALLQSTAVEVANREGRTLFLRHAEGSPHEDAFRLSGLVAYAREHLLCPPEPDSRPEQEEMRPAERADRAAVFRLYCRAVPEMVRRHEAITQHEFRAVLDLYNSHDEFVLDGTDGLLAWAGIGEHEAHLLTAPADGQAAAAALETIRVHLPVSGTLVLGEHQEHEYRIATECGFGPLGVRVVTARRLAALNSLKEALAVPVTSRVPN